MVKIVTMPKTLSLHMLELVATTLSTCTCDENAIYVYKDGDKIKSTGETNSEYAFTHEGKSYSLSTDNLNVVRITRIESVDLTRQYI